MVQRSEHADRVLNLARAQADRFGHRYLGPEHVVLGLLGDGDSVLMIAHQRPAMVVPDTSDRDGAVACAVGPVTIRTVSR